MMWDFLNSGNPIVYGGATITPNAKGRVGKTIFYKPDFVNNFIETSGAAPAYFDMLGGRYLAGPSGDWESWS